MNLGSIVFLTIWALPIHKLGMSFYLFRFALISFNNVLPLSLGPLKLFSYLKTYSPSRLHPGQGYKPLGLLAGPLWNVFLFVWRTPKHHAPSLACISGEEDCSLGSPPLPRMPCWPPVTHLLLDASMLVLGVHSSASPRTLWTGQRQ